MNATRLLRHSPWDGALVALACLHAALIIAWPSVPLIAVLLWWNANTIAHNFIHLPFFRSRRLNAAFSVVLTLLLGFPQRLWRARHLAHHAGREQAVDRWTGRIALEAGLVLLLWAALVAINPRFFCFVYAPGYVIGLALCQLHGYYEHAHGTTSHYGGWYNVMFFRDGLHVEHHARPSTHWSRLAPAGARASAWPPVFRWLDEIPRALDTLERIVLHSPILQRLVVRAHQRAIATALMTVGDVRRVAIVGGGLFPRTAIIMRRLCPDARITIIERNPRHLESIARFLGDAVTVSQGDCDAGCAFEADLVIIPLALIGDRERFYEAPPAPFVLIHDWIWRPRGDGARVAWWLLKRVNLVPRPAAHATRQAA